MGKPPALPGDSQSLTFPGLEEMLPIFEPLENNTKKVLDDSVSALLSYSYNLRIYESVCLYG
jgi:hypothetical protein